MNFFVDALQTLFMHVYINRNILKIEYSNSENLIVTFIQILFLKGGVML